MNKFYSLLSLFATTLLFQYSAVAQCSSNILSNGGFDSPLQSNIGNNLTGTSTFSGWTMTGGNFNIIRTDGSPYSGGPDNAQDGTQYVDVEGAAGTVYQDFSISSSGTPLAFGGYFSSRESGGYENWTASIDIISLPSLTVVATSNTRAFTSADGDGAAQEIWHYLEGSATLNAGNYRFVAKIGNFGNFDGAFVFKDCILPMKLEYFGGTYANKAVTLNWKFENQTDFSHFVVEKSLDGKNFKSVKNIYLTNSQSYNYKDIDLGTSSIFYYRLKMVDNDGRFSYSNVNKIHTETIGSFSVLGNPVKNHLNITGIKKGATLVIYDNAGKLVLRKNVQDQTFSMDISTLSSGVYYLQYAVNGLVENRTIIKQ